MARRTQVMGILNVTPDSFSDGGAYNDAARAVKHAEVMAAEGADIIDVGGESTRPGAAAVSPKTELRRVLPVINRIVRSLRVPVSIDTRNASVAAAALDAGAVIVNDVSALSFDADMAQVVARSGAAVILMHMRGSPETMQRAPKYNNVVEEVRRYLQDAARRAVRAGVLRDRIIIDPGIGFGKTVTHNIELIRNLKKICSAGYPVCVGLSRKSFIGELLGIERPQDRIFGSVAAQCVAVMNGARIIRTHDVRAARESLGVIDAFTA